MRVIVLHVAICVAFAIADEVLDKPGENDACAEQCKDMYKNQQPNVDICSEGCRVFSMLQFASRTADKSTIRQRCTDGCVNSFTELIQQKACKDGCLHQVPYTGGKLEISIDSKDPMYKVAKSAIDHVFDQMNEQMNENFGQFGSIFGERDPLLEMQNNVDDMENHLRQLMNRLTGASFPKPKEAIQRISGHGGDSFIGPLVDNLNAEGLPIIRVEMTPFTDDQFNWLDHEPQPPISHDRDRFVPDSWLSCMASRASRLSRITRLLVCVALFLCIASMIWICMAIVKTAPKLRLIVPKGSDLLKIATIDGHTNMNKHNCEKSYLIDQERSPFIPPVHNSPPPAYEEANDDKQAIVAD